jgi:hypothetical protein
VNEKLADVLRSVDLGQGALYPFQVFQHDRKTPIKLGPASMSIQEILRWLMMT